MVPLCIIMSASYRFDKTCITSCMLAAIFVKLSQKQERRVAGTAFAGGRRQFRSVRRDVAAFKVAVLGHCSKCHYKWVSLYRKSKS